MNLPDHRVILKICNLYTNGQKGWNCAKAEEKASSYSVKWCPSVLSPLPPALLAHSIREAADNSGCEPTQEMRNLSTTEGVKSQTEIADRACPLTIHVRRSSCPIVFVCRTVCNVPKSRNNLKKTKPKQRPQSVLNHAFHTQPFTNCCR